jgi:hypothetical protein
MGRCAKTNPSAAWESGAATLPAKTIVTLATVFDPVRRYSFTPEPATENANLAFPASGIPHYIPIFTPASAER